MADELALKSAAGRGLLLATVLGSSLAVLDGTVINVALPHIGREFDASVRDLQWTVNAYVLPLAAFVLLGGALGDRFGRRRIFLVGAVWFTVASLGCALAPNEQLLIAARALQGVGSALLTPGSLALIQASMRPDDRAKAIGAWAGLGGVAGALGPFVGGWMIDTLSWRWIFYLNVPLLLIVLVATLRWVPESRAPHAGERGFDLAGALLAALGLAGITYAMVSSDAVIAPLVVGLGALAAFGAVQVKREHPMIPPELFTSRQFVAINVVTLLVYGAMSGSMFFLVLQLQVVLGYSALAAGMALVPVTLLLLVGSPAAGAFGKRVGPRVPLSVGSALTAVSMLWLLRVGPDALYWRDVFPPVLVFGVGLTILVAPLTASVLAAAPDRLAGVASGVNNAVARAGSLLAVAALPLLVGLSGEQYADPVALDQRYHSATLWCAVLLGLGALTSVVFVQARTGEPVSPRDG